MIATPERGSPGPDGAPRMVFLVGCARSGTTWLQLLLSRHPGVATSQETHLFSRYISRLDQGWQFEHDPQYDRRRNTGLAAVLTADEFDALCRDFATRVLNRVLESKPGASLVLEKTPSHVRHGKLIRRLFPDAYFLHMVRDPRSVVSSLRAAGRSWGRHWAPTGPAAGAYMWRADVSAGIAIGELTDRYRELRYESLSADPVGELRGVLDWLGLPVDDAFCREAVEANDIERLKRGGAESNGAAWSLKDEPEGFYRKGAVQGWAEELTPGEVAVVEHIAGPLMSRFGYERTTRVKRRPARLVLRDALSWRLDGAHRWLARRVSTL